MRKDVSSGAEVIPPEPILSKIRIPHIQRASLTHRDERQDVFVVDLGLCGVFVERAEPLPIGDEVTVRFPLPGNEIPLEARCRVAWWHPAAGPLVSKVLPAGLGLEFLELPNEDRVRLRDYIVAYCRRHSRGRWFLPPWPRNEEEGQAP